MWQRQCRFRTLLVFSLILFALIGNASASQDDSSSHTAELVFQAQCQLKSEACCDDPDALREFLERPDIRNLFLSAGGKRPCQSLSIQEHYSSIADLWHQACEKYYGMNTLPKALGRIKNKGQDNGHGKNKEEIAVLATETEVHFPGFKTINSVLSGCHLLPRARDERQSNGFLFGHRNHLGHLTVNQEHAPSKDVVHKFYLVGDKKRWVGPAPVVWLVRKLTGDDGSSTAPYKLSETRAITEVSVYVQDTSDGTHKHQRPKVGFQLDIDCAVKVEFPQFLLRILPAPPSKVEERGTEAMRKAILQEAASAMQAVEEAWAQEQDRKQRFFQADHKSAHQKSLVHTLSG